MIARGKRERSEARRPWLVQQNSGQGLKGRNNYYALSGLDGRFICFQGRRASLRSRLPLAVIFRAVGAQTL